MVTGVVGSIKHSLKVNLIRARENVRLIGAYSYDLRRYQAVSSTNGPFGSRHNLAAKITERYHGIEKGLSLPTPRPGFGRGTVETLIRLVEVYLSDHGEDEVTAAALGALRAYWEFNAEHMSADEIPSGHRISELLVDHRANGPGVSGTLALSADEVRTATSGVGLEFFTSRHSVRIYAPEPVTNREIETALAAARSAPAVCNRQFGIVRTWRDRESIGNLLQIQGGARGFADNIPALALITVPLRSYWSAGERNQAWIDGGLFAMNFILGLHAQGLGAVPLNWSKAPIRDRVLRRALPEVEQHEAIIMFIGFGHLPAHYRVAASPRVKLG